jgi:hypothetical protein
MQRVCSSRCHSLTHNAAPCVCAAQADAVRDGSMLFSPSTPRLSQLHPPASLTDLTLSPVLPKPVMGAAAKQRSLPPSGSAFFVNTPHRSSFARPVVVDMNSSWDKSWSEPGLEPVGPALAPPVEVVNTDIRSRPHADSPNSNSPSFTTEKCMAGSSSIAGVSTNIGLPAMLPLDCLHAICAAVRELDVIVPAETSHPGVVYERAIADARFSLSTMAHRRGRFCSEDSIMRTGGALQAAAGGARDVRLCCASSPHLVNVS